MSDLIPRHMAVAACAIGPSDEWSKSTRSGYEQAALDCTMNILRVESELPHPLAALAMRERAAKACDSIAGNTADFPRDYRRAAGQCSAMIRALPTTFTDAELLAAAMQLPEVRALIEALKMASIWLNYDGRYDMQGINSSLAPFTKGGE
jgi:hypothetical protein